MGIWMVSGCMNARIASKGDCGCELAGIQDHTPIVRNPFNYCTKCYEPRFEIGRREIGSEEGGFKEIEIHCKCVCVLSNWCTRMS